MLYGQVDKFLVVGVATGHAGFGCGVDQLPMPVKLTEHCFKRQTEKIQHLDCFLGNLVRAPDEHAWRPIGPLIDPDVWVLAEKSNGCLISAH